ncbi:phage terminase small subunit [Halalkalibacter sp. AB-rgal2]|uniref:phage terminase small subunit n=1 Tax=Halalkalibacter sp. AB-rgal2 TaxID=3242695 RepID=UPI00359CF376
MARPRDPRRDEAKEAWLKSNGEAKLKDIAADLGVSSSTVRKWKAQDRWEDDLKGSAPKLKRSAPKRGAPKGSKNAKGNQGGKAPPGNKNAVGNSGGAAPPGNKNAVTTGEYETIFEDVLTEEEVEMFAHVDTTPLTQVDENIRLLSIRERRMLQRIKAVIEGMSEKERRVLQERIEKKVPVEVYDEKRGETKIIQTCKSELVTTELEETEYRKIDDVIKLEEALTRVQDKKLKAIKLKHEMDDRFHYQQNIDQERLNIDKEKVKAVTKDAELQQRQSEMFVSAIHTVAKKRLTKKNGDRS